MAIRIQLRKDHPSVWDSADPVLAAGEFGFAWDSADSASFGRLKIGDGSTSWTNLPYFYSAGDSAGNYASAGGAAAAWYGDRGVFSGGYSLSNDNTMDYVDITSASNATDFGDLTTARYELGSASNATSIFIAGGAIDNSPFVVNTIDYITVASTSSASDFGDLTATNRYLHATSNGTLGLIIGGDGGTKSFYCDYITIATASNATSFGTLTQGSQNGSGCSDGTYSVSHAGQYYSGGSLTGQSNILFYLTIATSGDTTDFGDLTNLDAFGQYNTAATSDATTGLFSGGNRTTANNSIHYVTIATPGNSADFGDLTAATHSHAGSSNNTYGLFAGGNVSGNSNKIDYITIASAGNAADFGDLSVARDSLTGSSGSPS